MGSIALLMGLLVLSYLGSLLVGSGRTRGLASGVEFIGLGFIVGPRALGFIERGMIADFEPIVQVALGWFAFVLGLDFGRVEGRRVSRASAAIGIACALVTGVIVGAAVWQFFRLTEIPGVDRQASLLLAAGAGAACAETSRYGAAWAQSRWNAKGPVSQLLVDIGASDDLAPLVAAGVVFTLAPTPAGVTLGLPMIGWFVASGGIGVLLGVVTALLLRDVEGDAVWSAVIGTVLLVVGTAARFGACTVFITFAMGIALAAGSPSRRALRQLVGPTERAVLYPMLLLAGARLDPWILVENRMLGALVALVILARIAAKLLSGLVVRAGAPAARPAGPLLGIVLLSAGPVSVSCGFVCALRFPGVVGDTLLLAAVASVILGELVSTLGLRGLLLETGEIALPAPAAPPPRAASVPPPSMAGTRGSAPPPAMGGESRFDLSELLRGDQER